MNDLLLSSMHLTYRSSQLNIRQVKSEQHGFSQCASSALCCVTCGVCWGRLYSLDWWTGWTGLEWTGLTQKSIKYLFQCRTEAKHTYSFTKVACIACFRVFLRVGRGQRSRAYLISFNEKIEEHLFTAEIELQPFAEA